MADAAATLACGQAAWRAATGAATRGARATARGPVAELRALRARLRTKKRYVIETSSSSTPNNVGCEPLVRIIR